MNTLNPPVARPVQLQANTSGAWKNVASFDAGNDMAVTQIQEGVILLFQADPDTSWRITAAYKGSSPTVLRRLDKGSFGIWIDT